MLVHRSNNLRPDGMYRQVTRLMGNRFEFTAVAESEMQAIQGIEAAIAEVQRIEKLLTTFDAGSRTNEVNRSAGLRPVQVEKEMFDLVNRSLKISRLTQGAFDITYGSMDKKLWNFDTTMTRLPDTATAREMVRLINYQNVEMDPRACTIFLKEKGMRIGFGGIGKGYAAERARTMMRAAGIDSGIVNAAGDLAAWGSQPDGSAWTIGIADPEQSSQPFSSLAISNLAVATSGDYEKYAVIDGKRISHTIDPRTGLPVTGIRSVTILCPDAEIADALTTPVMIMGKEAGLHLINQMHHIGCIIVDEHHRIYTSHNIHPC